MGAGDIFSFSLDHHFAQTMLRMGTAVLCGVIVGFERGLRAKPAGVRTNMLICLGSCLFMIISEYVARSAKLEGYANPDPARIAAQVVSGIGFLGAGAILRNHGIVTGLTTAASIWGVAAIGLAAGEGLISIAVISSILIVLTLEAFSWVEHKVNMVRARYMKLETIIKKETRVRSIRKTLRTMGISFSQENLDHILGECHYSAVLYFKGDRDKEVQKKLMEIPGIRQAILVSPTAD